METSESEEFDIKIGAVFSLATSLGNENTNHSDNVAGSVPNSNDEISETESKHKYDDCKSARVWSSVDTPKAPLPGKISEQKTTAKTEEVCHPVSIKIEPVSPQPEIVSDFDSLDSNNSKALEDLCNTDQVSGENSSSSSNSSVTVERRTGRKRKPNQIFSDSYMLDYKGTSSLRNVTISLEEAKQAQKGQLPVKESTTPCLSGRSNADKLDAISQRTSDNLKTKVNTETKLRNEFTKEELNSSSKSKRRKSNRTDSNETSDKCASDALLQNRVKDLYRSVSRKKKILYSELTKGPDVGESKRQRENVTKTTISGTKNVKRSLNGKKKGSGSSNKSDVSDGERNLVSAPLKIKTESITFDESGENLGGSDIFQSPASELDIPYRVSKNVTKGSKEGEYSTQYDRNWLIKGNSGSMILASVEGQMSPGPSSMTTKTPLKKDNPSSCSLATKAPILNSLITKVPASTSAPTESRNTNQTPSVKTSLALTPPSSASGKAETKIDVVLPPDKENSINALKYVRAPAYSQTVKEIAKVQNTKKFFQLVIGNKVVLIPTDGDDIIPKAYIVDMLKAKGGAGSVTTEKSKPTLKIAVDSTIGSNGKDNSSPPVLSPQEPVRINFESRNEVESKPPVLHPETTVTIVPPPGTSKQRLPAKASPNLRSLLPNIISKGGVPAQSGTTTNISTLQSSGTNGTSNLAPRPNNNNVPSVGGTSSTTGSSSNSGVQPQCSTLVTNSFPHNRASSLDSNETEDVSERIRKLREKLKSQQKDVENARLSIKTFKSIDEDDVT